MAEWTTARETLGAYDERLHDLRKVGFTFLTALLTAEAILVPATPAGPGGTPAATGVPDYIKLAVFSVTLLVIVAVQFIEKNYQLFVKALVLRATVLERMLNLELTETISDRYRAEHLAWYETGLYLALSLGTLVLGVSILGPGTLASWGLGLVWVVAVGSILFIRRRELTLDRGYTDWTLDPLVVPQGGTVRIILTNLSTPPRRRPLGKGPAEVTKEDLRVHTVDAGVAWLVLEQGAKEIRELDGITNADVLKKLACTRMEVLDSGIDLYPGEEYIWTWHTGDVREGVYEVFPQHYSYTRRLLRKPLKEGPSWDWGIPAKICVVPRRGSPLGLPAEASDASEG